MTAPSESNSPPRCRLLAPLVVIVVLVVSGCAPPLEGTLTLTEEWNAGDTYSFDAVGGESVTVSSCIGELDIAVDSVGSESVTITTSLEMSKRGASGDRFNLNDPTSEFEVPAGGAVEFASPTTDSSCAYTMSLSGQ